MITKAVCMGKAVIAVTTAVKSRTVAEIQMVAPNRATAMINFHRIDWSLLFSFKGAIVKEHRLVGR
jgi:hypothetical protein